MKKSLCTLLAVVMTMSSSVVAFAKDSNTVPNFEVPASLDTIQPRLTEKDIKIRVLQTETEIISDYNICDENVTVIVKSVDKLVGSINLTIEYADGTRKTKKQLSTGKTATFYDVPSGGYTIYASSNQRSGYCIFSFADNIFSAR